MPIVFSMKIRTFSKVTLLKVTQFLSLSNEIFRKCSESVNFDVNNNLQEDLKIFKSDTFETTKVLYLQMFRAILLICTVLTNHSVHQIYPYRQVFSQQCIELMTCDQINVFFGHFFQKKAFFGIEKYNYIGIMLGTHTAVLKTY